MSRMRWVPLLMMIVALTVLFVAEAAKPQLGYSNVIGEWKVVRHMTPGFAAMSSKEADAWLGRTASYSEDRARFDRDNCDYPTYTVRQLSVEAFFSEFRTAPKDLGLPDTEVTVIEIRCRGSDWIAPGTVLLLKSKTRIITLWDGVFFELQRR